ncbi:SPOR domain-containing protein [Halomonas caseinilytica]|uniref:SPOR domain-containing protein n=1 Tax=Halomonas caseinilytica TaxID=438744 RepID=UPI0008494BBC|nr:SPOR domain-containing protein [Halomonas caseinilytica]
MATRKKTPPRKRGATSQRRSSKGKAPRRGLPGWLWGLAGLVAGFLISQHQHGTAPWQEAPETPLARSESPSSETPPEDDTSKEQDAKSDESPMPTFEFYTLLPESEVVAPGGQVPDSPPSRPKRKESTSQDEASESQASADDPIAQVIAANTTQSSEASSDEPEIEADGRYMLQAASFRSTADARQLADRLKNFGLLANITEVKTGDGTTWHRVQAGPYTDRNELTRAQDLMVTQGIEPLLIQLQN